MPENNKKNLSEAKTITILQPSDSPSVNLAIDTIRLGKQALVFANTKRSAEKVAEDIAVKIKKENINNEKALFDLSEKARTTLSSPTTQCERLARCLRKGIAFHHAGLTQKQKDLIEEEFRTGKIKIICCTPTLAYGVDLPAFRAIMRDLRRYGQRGLTWIPVLDYQQICGRAGRPKYDSYGEAIAIASTEKEKEKLEEIYIHGEAEEIYSKLAVEPVLRTYVLSLIASGFVSERKELAEFFSRTFWAYQFEDMGKLDKIIEKMLNLLVSYDFIVYNSDEAPEKENILKPSIRMKQAEKYNEEQWYSTEEQAFNEFDDFISATEVKKNFKPKKEGKLSATLIGKRVAQLYLDPLTAHNLINSINHAAAKKTTEFSYLQMVSYSLELRPLLKVKQSEYDSITAELVECADELITLEPTMYDPEYDEFLNSVKTARFFDEWIDEKDEEYLLEKYAIRPGEIRVKLNLADWLLYSAEEMAKLLKKHEVIKDIMKARYRLKYGVKEELLPLLKLKGIGRARARNLFKNKIHDIGDLKKMDLMALVQIVGKNTAISLKKQVGIDVDKQKIPERRRKGQISLNDFA